MKTLADALAGLDEADLEISELHPKELRDALQRYANAQRELIKALDKCDGPHQLTAPPRRKPNFVVVR